MADSLAVIAQEITMIRKLIVFSLLSSGVSQEKVASALGVSQATVSRLAGTRSLPAKRANIKKKGKA